MIQRNGIPPMLMGCDVLPAMNGDSSPLRSSPPKASKPKGKAGGRFAVLNAFVDFTAGTLNRSEILVWLVLYRDCRDGIARTSQADIARRGGICARTVRNAIKGLERRGLLKVVHRGGLNRGPSIYRPRGIPPD